MPILAKQPESASFRVSFPQTSRQRTQNFGKDFNFEAIFAEKIHQNPPLQ
jgi:hypothetical protein